MQFKNWLIKEEIKLKIKKQSHDHDCGPAALFSILSYFKIKDLDYKKLVTMCKTTKNKGTSPDNIVAVAKNFGLKAKKNYNMTLQNLKSYTDKNKPVLVPIQSWGNYKNKKLLISGHYVIVSKIDQNFVYFKDPYYQSKDNRKMNRDDFLKAWIDKLNGKELKQFGIVFDI